MNELTGLEGSQIDDVIMGCAFPEAEQGMNVARTAIDRSGFAGRNFGDDGKSLLFVGFADDRARGGQNSNRRRGYHCRRRFGNDVDDSDGRKCFRPNPKIVDNYPDYYLNMGLTAEAIWRKNTRFRVNEQDEFSLGSHQKAAAAIQGGKFKDEIVPFTVLVDEFDEKGRVRRKEVVFDTDEGVRYDAIARRICKNSVRFFTQKER